MFARRLAILAAAPFIVVLLGGFMRGGFAATPTPTFEGADWREVLLKVPCELVAKDRRELKVNAVLIIGRQTFNEPVIREENQIRELDRRCFQQR